MLKDGMSIQKSTMRFKNALIKSSLTGILVGTSYIPFPPWAIFFCFIPLWDLWFQTPSKRRVIFSGWIAQFLLVCIGFFWIKTVAHEFGHLPKPVAILAVVLYASFACWYIPASGFIWKSLHDKFKLSKVPSLYLLATLTALFEHFYWTIFPWNFGYTWLWAGLPAYQLAEYIGFSALSSLIIIANAATLQTYWSYKDKQLNLKPLAAVLVLFGIMNGLGVLAKSRLAKPDAEAKVLIVQANIGNQQKIYAEKGWGFREEIVNRHLRLTTEGLIDDGPVDFAVWPETAYPETLGGRNYRRRNARNLSRYLQSNELNLMTGGYYQGFESPANRTANGLFTFKKETGLPDRRPYLKSHLLAFGEYIPGSDTFPQLNNLFPAVANFIRGQGPEVQGIDDIQIGPQICYESLFPEYSNQLARLGADLIVNVTNDSWYGPYSEPYQHLYMTLARAIETRRPLVRSTNTGISTVILADGTILENSPLYQEWKHTFNIPYKKQAKTTFFTDFPYLHPTLLGFIFLVLLFLGAKQGFKPKDEQLKPDDN